MDNEKLRKANELSEKIRNNKRLINHFINKDGKPNFNEKNSLNDWLIPFFTKCSNLTSHLNLNIEAYLILERYITEKMREHDALTKEFNNL